MEQPTPFAPSPDAAEEDQSPEIHFIPVPRLRMRRNGWSPARQRAFIAALAGCGSVARAARAVGMTSRSAYRLMDADGADSFAAAWDEAIEAGIERVRTDALERALNGAPVALFRRGKLVRVEQRRNDRLAIALLGGQWRGGVDDYRRSAVSRRQYYQELKAADAARAEAARKAQAIRDQHLAILDALAAEAEHAKAKPIPAVEPRVRKL
jgi:hypothetical protein